MRILPYPLFILVIFILISTNDVEAQCGGCPVGFTVNIAGNTLTANGSHNGNGGGCNGGNTTDFFGNCTSPNCTSCILGNGETANGFSMDLDIFCGSTGAQVFFDDEPINYNGQTACNFGTQAFNTISVDLTTIGLCAGAEYIYTLREYSCTNGYDSGVQVNNTFIAPGTPPSITCPMDATTYDCFADIPAPPTSAIVNNVGDCIVTSNSITSTIDAGDNCGGTRTYTYTVEFGCELEPLTCELVVNVTDDVNPTFTNCPTQADIPIDSDCMAAIPDFTAIATATDNCGGGVIITQSIAAGTMVGPGPQSVTLTATDACMNAISDCVISFEVTGVCCTFDAACPANLNLGTFDCTTFGDIPAAPATVGALTADYGITIDDMCGMIAFTSMDNGVPDACLSSTIIREIVVFDDLDGSGTLNGEEESITCDFTITIEEDLTIPIFDQPLPMNLNLSCTDPIPAAGVLTATDNCSENELNATITEVHYDNAGSDTGEFVEIAIPADGCNYFVALYNGAN